MNVQPLISIVVPVYNVKQFLTKCLNSIISQTYSNLEIIVVDDGSTDGSATICDDYAKKDKRISVIHKENGGLASARNAGNVVTSCDNVRTYCRRITVAAGSPDVLKTLLFQRLR